jgi:hypothetical protein
MSEDAERQRRREYLMRQKEKVMKAQQWLMAENIAHEPDNEPRDFGFEIKSQPSDE